MTAAAAKRGVRLTSRSRPLAPADFKRFKYIIGMDASNMRSIQVGQPVPRRHPWAMRRALITCRGRALLARYRPARAACSSA
jgi:protein-tyrosine-phosphatase